MATLTGPLLSLKATKQLAQAIIFQSPPHGPMATRYHVPTNPRSPAQLAVRALTKWIQQQWQWFAPDDQTSWDALATPRHTSRINECLRANHAAFWNNLGLHRRHPCPDPLDPEDLVTVSLTHDGPLVTATIADSWIEHAFGIAVFRSTSPIITINRKTLVGFVGAWQDLAFPLTYTESLTGTLYFRLQYFSNEGLVTPPSDQQSITI
jgi:hypothetical protein